MADNGSPEDPISALLRMVTGSGSPDVTAVMPWLRRMMNAAADADPWSTASRQPPPPPPPAPRPPQPRPPRAAPRLVPPAGGGGDEGSRTLYWSLLDLVGDLQRSWSRGDAGPAQADVVDLALKGVMTALNTPAVREQFAPRPLRVVREEPAAGEFEVYRTKGGGYGFRLRDEDGEVLASAKGFASKQEVLDTIAAVREYAAAPVVDATADAPAARPTAVSTPDDDADDETAAAPAPAATSRRSASRKATGAGAGTTSSRRAAPSRSTAARSGTAAKATKKAAKKSTADKTTAKRTTTAKQPSRKATGKSARAPRPAPEAFESD